MDLGGMSVTKIPIKSLYDIIHGMGLYYCGNVAKTYIFNAKGIETIWNLIKSLLPEHARKKVVFIEEGNGEEILKQIDPLELEKKYGGKLENLKEFWPPKCTNEEFDCIQMLKQKGKEDDALTNTEFYSVCNDASFFQEEEGICGKASCGGECRIF
jgi:hypothetical protein